MNCANCYIPNREIPDMDAEWLADILRRLPRRTRIRLVGAEPTMRKDLPELIAMVRALGHHPVILTNGLRLRDRKYLARLKEAGLRTVYLSMNGGLNDDYCEKIDELRCAPRKIQALENLVAARMFVTVGMNVVPGLNDRHIGEFYRYLRDMGVQDFHLRSIGEIGRYMKDCGCSLKTLIAIAARELQVDADTIEAGRFDTPSSRDFVCEKMRVQITEWPDLGSRRRGRITPRGRVEPLFEHIILNSGPGGY